MSGPSVQRLVMASVSDSKEKINLQIANSKNAEVDVPTGQRGKSGLSATNHVAVEPSNDYVIA